MSSVWCSDSIAQRFFIYFYRGGRDQDLLALEMRDFGVPTTYPLDIRV